MLSDGVRHEAHIEALRRVVKPGSFVIDIGTGNGVYALIAAELGARRVLAIDPNPFVQLGRQHAVDNELESRVEFICGLSTDVAPSELADVIVTDLRDTLPFNGRHFAATRDARQRLLGPGGTMTPTRDVVFAAPVECPDLHAEVCGPWVSPIEGLDFSAALEYEANTMRFANVLQRDVLSEPIVFADLVYDAEADLERTYSIDRTVKIERPGTAHALALWFDATVIPGIGYTTGPGRPTVYRNAFLPLRHPLELAPNDTVRVQISCRLNSSWDWQWLVTLEGEAGHRRSSPWQQSTLRSVVVSDEALRAMVGRQRIVKADELALDRELLDSLASGSSPADLVSRVMDERGVGFRVASGRVTELVSRYFT